MNHSDTQLNAFKADLEFGFLNSKLATAEIYNPKLISNSASQTMLNAIERELKNAERFIFSVAFITTNALAALKQHILDFSGSGVIITSTYLNFNTPEVFQELLNLPGVDVFVYDEAANFHAKGYLFEHEQSTTAIVGSSNLTLTALAKNTEWNLRFSAMPDGDIVRQLNGAIDLQLQRAVPLTRLWINSYAKIHQQILHKHAASQPLESVDIGAQLESIFVQADAIKPNNMQKQALQEIAKVRDTGEKRAIVVSATGTGKTILSALDVRAVKPNRLLFIVHREQILDRAIEEYKRVIRDTDISFGKLAGGIKETNKDYLFATVQSLSKLKTLNSFDSEAFDYIIIDEVHRAGSKTYKEIIDYFDPDFLLGFTATPERTDGFNIFELFDYNVPYEIRLQQALNDDLLAPFHYYGVTDFVTAAGEVIDDTAQLEQLVLPERIDYLLEKIALYGHVGISVKGLIFVSNVAEADALAVALNEKYLFDKRLRTIALTGENTVAERESAVELLENGDLDYIITVDIFNEGVDIPVVNQIVMMRQTQSAIIFTQQLGRGLRKAAGKDHLRVIDFIGNYQNNYLIPVALFGDNSLNKDSLRSAMTEAQEAGVLAGLSSVSFDEISRNKIFKAIENTNLASMHNIKKAFQDLEFRLGRVPSLLDFARFDTADPVVVANKAKNFWSLTAKFKKSSVSPSAIQTKFLNFLSKEILNGQRPHELLLLKHLLTEVSSKIDAGISRADFQRLLIKAECASDDATVDSVARVLDLSFFTVTQRKAYGDIPLVAFEDDVFKLYSSFAAECEGVSDSAILFKQHVYDLVETGLYLSRHRYAWSSGLRVGEKYSRKEACRLLNWASNQEAIIYGYKVDYFSNTCPIFVTYHKDEEAVDNLKYPDEFLSPATLKWFTRNNRTLESAEVKSIIENKISQHLFVKKDDAEGFDFFYLGQVQSKNPEQTTIRGNKGVPLDVVTMHLELETSISSGIFDYLTTISN